MDDEGLKKYLRRARKLAMSRGYHHLADDFASEVVLTLIENKRQKAALNHLFVDYLRKEFGRREGSAARKRSHALPIEHALSVRDHRPYSEWLAQWNFAHLFTERAREIYDLYFLDGHTAAEIGDHFGIGESRVCMILKEMKKRIRACYFNAGQVRTARSERQYAAESNQRWTRRKRPAKRSLSRPR